MALFKHCSHEELEMPYIVGVMTFLSHLGFDTFFSYCSTYQVQAYGQITFDSPPRPNDDLLYFCFRNLKRVTCCRSHWHFRRLNNWCKFVSHTSLFQVYQSPLVNSFKYWCEAYISEPKMTRTIIITICHI